MTEVGSPVHVYDPVHLDRENLAGKALELWHEKNQKAWKITSAAQKTNLLEDFNGTIESLEISLSTGNAALLIDYIRWLEVFASSRQYPEDYVSSLLTVLKIVIGKELPADRRAEALSMVRKSAGAMVKAPVSVPSFIRNEEAHAAFAHSYLEALLQGDRDRATLIIDQAAGSGVAVRDIYLNVILPVLRETGRLWQLQKITIAEEHYISASVLLAVLRLHDRILATKGESRHRTLVAASVANEFHDIGIRIVADFFEMDGWTAYFTGANTPAESLLSTVRERKPEVLAISVTMASHIPVVHYLIRSIRGDPRTERVKVLVGGYPFSIVPLLWKQVGADAYALDPDEAVRTMNRLIEMER
ncbi:MAG TPA: cobalamin-dependent protein [Methanoregulaceae archaeon]|nr:cobalamin-dependent protein [Methanoregulaceae archaeon]